MRWFSPFALASVVATTAWLAGCGSTTVPGDAAVDAGPTDGTTADVSATDSAPNNDAFPPIGSQGGTVALLHFADFGDCRPANPNDTPNYPTTIINQVMSGISGFGAQFAIASGDYMFAEDPLAAQSAQDQVALLLQAESTYSGHVFHSVGNHECNTATAGNCPNGNETPNMMEFASQLAPDYSTVYYDWVVHTSMGDAHFVATAPNAWSDAQQAWLTSALAQTATYTFVIAHEPPSDGGPGTSAIETSIGARPGGTVTLKIYGHSHEYRHIGTNQVISGNAGAPLDGRNSHYGFLMIDQLADGNIQVTEYSIGNPPMLGDTWIVTPAGSLTN